MKNDWTNEEMEQFKIDYFILTNEELTNKYKRSITALQSKAQKLKIKGRNKYLNAKIQNNTKQGMDYIKSIEKEICELYKSKETPSSIQIANKFNISKPTVLRVLKRNNIERRDIRESHRIYEVNQDFFDTWSVESAYLIGVIFSDGHVKNDDRQEISIAWSIGDKEHLQFLNDLLQPTRPLQFYSNHKARAKGKNYQDTYRMAIQCKKIVDKFTYEYNCPQVKSLILEFPTFIPDEFMPAFIAGYCAGDAGLSKCVSHTETDKLGNPKITYHYGILGSDVFCEKLQEYIRNKIGLNCSLAKDKRTEKLRTCYITGFQSIHKFLLFLNKYCPYMLERKTQTWKELQEYFNTKPRMKQMSNQLCADGIYKNGVRVWEIPDL